MPANDKKVQCKSTVSKKRSAIKPRMKQRTFKNEELSINKIKKDYEKFTLQPKPGKRLS